MADYTNSKTAPWSQYPAGGIDSDGFQRYEPLVTVDQLKFRYLWGIPLVSLFPDPVTGERQKLTDPMLQDIIQRAAVLAETQLHINIFPVQYQERVAYDRVHFASFGYIRSKHKPITSVDNLSIVMTNNSLIYTISPDWIDNGGFFRGRVNLVPLTVASTTSGGGVVSTDGNAGAGALFLNIMGVNWWIPAFWTMQYTCGFPNGNVPQFINDLIGMNSAIEILNLIMTTNIHNSYSLSIDGLSQSATNNGPQLFRDRVKALEEQRDKLVSYAKGAFGTKFLSSNV